jgi:hypothetical protein
MLDIPSNLTARDLALIVMDFNYSYAKICESVAMNNKNSRAKRDRAHGALAYILELDTRLQKILSIIGEKHA